MKRKLIAAAAVLLPLLLLVGAWKARGILIRLMPVRHTGEVLRIGTFHKGGMGQRDQGTRQIRQFAVLFEDGFMCEGHDTSLSAVKPGDIVEIRGYHDVKGWPLLDPEWWECDEAQLVGVSVPSAP